jgi:hypothetical protein
MAAKKDDNFVLDESGGLLRDTDIPPRRRAPGEVPVDPVTEILLSSVTFNQNFNGDGAEDPISQELFRQVRRVPRKAPPRPKVASLSRALPVSESQSPREAILSELATFHKEEEDRRARLSLPRPVLSLESDRTHTSPPAPLPGAIDAVGGMPEKTVSPDQDRSTSAARERDGWLTVRWADLPEPAVPLKSRGMRFGKQITLALLLLAAIAGGVWGTFRTGILTGGLARLPFVGSFFASSSFLVLNSDERTALGPVSALYENAVALRKEKESALSARSLDELDGLIQSLEVFLQKNQAFSWLNVMRPENAYLSAPQELDTLEEALVRREEFERLSGEVLSPGSEELAAYTTQFKFWSGVIGADGRYLVLFGGGRAGGTLPEPQHFAVVEISKSKMQLQTHGMVADLNAALTSKYIPPEPVQVYKTSLDLAEAGWEYDFASYGNIAQSLFEETTRTETAGVFVVSGDVADELARAVGVKRSETDARWIKEMFDRYSRAEAGTWEKVSAALRAGVAAHTVQAFFEDAGRQDFARRARYAQAAGEGAEIGLSVRQWEGESVQLLLSELRAHFFPDGSVLQTPRVTFRNDGAVPARLYVQWYVENGAQILSGTGYGARPAAPKFAYEQEGFQPHPALSGRARLPSETLRSLDLWSEGRLFAVGGWVTVPAHSTHTASLEYRAPQRLDWQKGEAPYTVRILRPGAFAEFPFRFQATMEDSVGFRWVDPLGFTTDTFAEYQERLSADRTFSAVIKFASE